MASQINRRQDLLNNCIKELQSCIDYVQKYSDTTEEDLNALKDVAKQYCETEIEHTRAQAAREATDRHFENQENDCTESVEDIYNKYLEQQPADVSYLNHSIWRKIKQTINDGTDQGEATEGDDEEVVIAEGNYEDEEEGIIPSQFVPPVDPITKKVIQDPCKNRKCGHIYEHSTVLDHLNKIKQNKSKPRCPYIGCNNVQMRPSFIVKDNVLKQQIQNYLANISRRSEPETSTSNIIL